MSQTSRKFVNNLPGSVEFMAFNSANENKDFTEVSGTISPAGPGAGTNELVYTEAKYIAIKTDVGVNYAFSPHEDVEATLEQINTAHPDHSNAAIAVFETVYKSSGGGSKTDIQIVEPPDIYP